MEKGSEKELQAQVLKWLKAHPRVARVWTTDTTKTRTRRFNTGQDKKGIADVHCVLKPDGRYCAIELKVGSNDCSPDQLRFLHDISNAGGLAFAAWSLDEVQVRFRVSGIVA